MKIRGLFATIIFAAIAACEITGGDANDDAGTADDGGDGGHDCTPNNSDGATQCTNETCQAGQFCDSTFGTCEAGCASTLNCAQGEYCDLRMPSQNVDGSIDIGICRAPGAECGASDDTAEGPDDGADDGVDETGASGCPDVQANYAVFLDGDSPDVCNDALAGTTMCSVTQSACTVVFGCDGDFGSQLPDGSVSSSGVYMSSGTFMGVPFTCTVTFDVSPSNSFEWECSGAGVLCTGSGV